MKFALLCPGNETYTPIAFQGAWRTRGDYVQNWCAILEGDYWTGNIFPTDQPILEMLDSYDVVLVNCNTTMLQTICYLSENLKHAKVIAHEDGSPDDITLVGIQDKAGMLDAARAADMMVVYQTWAEDWFELLTDKPVRYVGFPCAPDLAMQYKRPLTEREDFIVLGRPIGAGGADRNGIGTALMVQKALPSVPMVTWYHDPVEIEFAKKYLPMLKQIEPLGQHEYWQLLSRAKLGVHMDHRYCFGRFALECAALAVPCIGTPNSGVSQALWPMTSYHPFMGASYAVDMIRELWNNEDAALTCCTHALVGLEAFSDAKTGERFRKVVKEEFGIE